MKLSREAIQRMVGDRAGGGGGTGGSGGGGSMAGYATEMWVNDNYLSIDFFSKLFKAYDSAATPNEVKPNDTESTITNIKAMFGFWTEQYISALGQNSGGGGGGGVSALSDLTDVQLTTPIGNGQVLKYNATLGKWVNANESGGGGGTGTVTSITAGTGLTGGVITTSGTIALSSATQTDIGKGVTAYGWGDHAQAGYATQTWVGQQGFALASNVYSKTDADAKFMTIVAFENLFNAIGSDGTTKVNHPYSSGVASIKAMLGLWTNEYLSALGLNSGGGGGGTLAGLSDVQLTNPSDGQVLKYNATLGKWVNANESGGGTGTVTSITAGTGLTGGVITTSGTIALSSATQTDIGKGVTAYGWGDHAQAGYATQTWVGQQGFALASNVYSKTDADAKFMTIVAFENLFNAIGSDGTTKVNHPYSSGVASIKAMLGLWTNEYLSALGLNSGGGGGGTLAGLNDVQLSSPSDGQVLKYNSTLNKWVNANESGGGGGTGTVTSITAGTGLTGGTITTSGTIALSSATQTDIGKGVTAYGWGDHAQAGYALASNVYSKTDADAKFMTIVAFENLFNAIGSDGTTKVNHPYASGVASIKAMVGLWTNQYLSALGLNSSGGGGGTLAGLSDVQLTSPSDGQVLKYNATLSKWVNANESGGGGTGTVTSITAGTGLTGGTITTSGTIALSTATQTDIGYGVTAYGWGNHANAGYLTSSDIADMATQTWVGQQGFLTGNSSIGFSQLPTLYWANVQVSNASNNATSPQFANLTLRNGSATYGSYLYFGDSGAYITEYSEDYLIYNAENGHLFSTQDFEPLEITGSGYVYIKSDGYAGNGLRIGDALLQWDSTNNALKVVKYDGTAGNLYATGGVSALGMQSGGSGGVTALTDLVDVAISSPTNGQVLMYNGTTGKWYNGTVQSSGGTVTSITAGTGLSGGTITSSGTIALTDEVQTAIAKGVTAYGWGNHANAGYLTSSDIADMATETWVGQQGFLTGSSSIAFSQLPTLYWANVQVSNASNNATSPQFANLTLRNGSATYGSTLYFGDQGAFIKEHTEDFLVYNAENGHKFTTMDFEPLEITGSGYVYIKSDGSYGNGLRIGDALLKWDSTNNALKVMKADGTAGNLYATGGVSALGMSAGTSAVDAMTFNYLTAANRLYIGDTSSYIYNDNTDIRLKSEGDVVLDGRTWMRGNVYMVSGKYFYLSSTSTTGRIYLSSDVYLYTDGSDLKINISGTNYKLYKLSA